MDDHGERRYRAWANAMSQVIADEYGEGSPGEGRRPLEGTPTRGDSNREPHGPTDSVEEIMAQVEREMGREDDDESALSRLFLTWGAAGSVVGWILGAAVGGASASTIGIFLGAPVAIAAAAMVVWVQKHAAAREHADDHREPPFFGDLDRQWARSSTRNR